MSIDREDGPVKHYRMKCDSCGKQTKRFAYEFYFENDAPAGWKELDGDNWDRKHHCPKCASSTIDNAKKEIIPNVGDGFEMSDHESVSRPLIRKDANTLIVDLQDSCKLVITSNAAIKVEQKED
jgi:ribosomal protein S27AE